MASIQSEPSDPSQAAALNLTTVGKRLAYARAQCQVTQEYVAEVCGLTKGAISAIENDRNSISGENLFPIADALGVSARWLISGQGDVSMKSESGSPIINRIARHLAALPDEQLSALSVVLGIRL